MKFPLASTVSIGKYVAVQQRKGERYPLVLMLEPTLACNIACIGCGKIREYESNRARLSVEECVDAAIQCPAPVVSICGGEPLVYKGIDEVASQVLEFGKTIELCTNALRLEQCLDWFEPSNRLTFVIHLDGMREIHDYVCDYPGLWDIAIDAIKTARDRGFRVTTNTTIFKETEVGDVIEMMRYLTAGIFPTYEALLEGMAWEAYGPGNDPRCEHCGIHCGFEPSAAYEASQSLKETVRSLAWTLTG